MPAKSPVYKTVVEVTLLTTYEDVAHGTLEEMISEAASGEAVLGYTVTECYALPESEIRQELIALGNDGEFFEEDSEEDE